MQFHASLFNEVRLCSTAVHAGLHAYVQTLYRSIADQHQYRPYKQEQWKQQTKQRRKDSLLHDERYL